MNCETSRESLALWIEADLPTADLPAMEAHLLGCPACRTFRTELGDSQTQFRSLCDEPTDVDVLDKIRKTVLAETASASGLTPNQRPRIPAWAYAAAAALLIALIGLAALRPSPELEPVRTAEVDAVPEASEAPPPPEVAAPEPVAQPEAIAVASRTEDPQPVPVPPIIEAETGVADATPNETQSLTVKLLTDDPNVVIYWVVDQVGGLE